MAVKTPTLFVAALDGATLRAQDRRDEEGDPAAGLRTIPLVVRGRSCSLERRLRHAMMEFLPFGLLYWGVGPTRYGFPSEHPSSRFAAHGAEWSMKSVNARSNPRRLARWCNALLGSSTSNCGGFKEQ